MLILHVGYAFVPLGFLLNGAVGVRAACRRAPASMPGRRGAIGIMTLAVMTRATLGHTGQQLTASYPTQAIYAAIIVAALARICAVVEPAHSEVLLHVAAFGWAIAFIGFALLYGRALCSPRVA